MKVNDIIARLKKQGVGSLVDLTHNSAFGERCVVAGVLSINILSEEQVTTFIDPVAIAIDKSSQGAAQVIEACKPNSKVICCLESFSEFLHIGLLRELSQLGCVIEGVFNVNMPGLPICVLATKASSCSAALRNEFFFTRQSYLKLAQEKARLDSVVSGLRAELSKEKKGHLALAALLAERTSSYETIISNLKVNTEKYKLEAQALGARYSKLRHSLTFSLVDAVRKAIVKPGRNTLLLPLRVAIISGRALFRRISILRSLILRGRRIIDSPKSNTADLYRKLVLAGSNHGPVKGILFGYVNPNIVDGSSIWLKNIVEVLSSKSANVLILKNNLEISKVIDRAKYPSGLLLEPRDFGHSAFDPEAAAQSIQLADECLEASSFVIVRGTDVLLNLVKTNCLSGRIIPYLTDFYSVTPNGPKVTKLDTRTFSMINRQVKFWLWQTPQIKAWVEGEFGKEVQVRSKIFPPLVPTVEPVDTNSRKTRQRQSPIVIGYGGKIHPDWGVHDLLNCVKANNDKPDRLYDLKVKIISSKVTEVSPIDGDISRSKSITRLLDSSFVEVISGASRDDCIAHLRTVDLIWAYRPAYFEEHTMELSTKLLEGLAIGLPTICYPNKVNRDLLGPDYPYYLKDCDTLPDVLNRPVDWAYLSRLAKSISERFSIESRRMTFDLETPKELSSQRIVLAGHDFKFIDHWYSDLRSNGYRVVKDRWEWGRAVSEQGSRHFYESSDAIFCEWGLANAAWYSDINKQKKPLFVRIHAQEVREKAMKFGARIRVENVSKFIFVSETIRRKALALFNWPEEKTLLIPNYVVTDDFLFQTKPPMSEGVHFGMVGIVPQSKGFARALDFIEGAIKVCPGIKLYVKGKRPEDILWMNQAGRKHELDYYEKQYERIRQTPGLAQSVVFDPFDNDMPSWYKKIHYILSPSDHESFHYAVADGVASGCLPIIWPWAGASEIYSPAWVVENTDGAIEYFLRHQAMSDAEILEKREASRQLICERYGSRAIFRKLNEIVFS